MAKLNIGCGRNTRPGWVNVDLAPLPGVDVVADLDDCRRTPLPLADDSADELLLSHVIEHIRDPLALMEELHRVARPGARMEIRVPHGASDDAYEDPTHVRQYFHHSFGYFSQPYYWRADYGYRGDWQPKLLRLRVDPARFAGLPRSPQAWLQVIQRERNTVVEMVCELVAMKPARAADRALLAEPEVEIEFA